MSTETKRPTFRDPVPYEGCSIEEVESNKRYNRTLEGVMPFIEQLESQLDEMTAERDLQRTLLQEAYRLLDLECPNDRITEKIEKYLIDGNVQNMHNANELEIITTTPITETIKVKLLNLYKIWNHKDWVSKSQGYYDYTNSRNILTQSEADALIQKATVEKLNEKKVWFDRPDMQIEYWKQGVPGEYLGKIKSSNGTFVRKLQSEADSLIADAEKQALALTTCPDCGQKYEHADLHYWHDENGRHCKKD